MSEHARLREFHDEEERIKLKMLQADAGLIGNRDILVTAERMDWMYQNPAQAQKDKEAEDFLLGKSAPADEREEMKKRLGVGTKAPGSLFLSSVTVQNEDTLRRLREDPLFMIRQAEHQQHRMDLARQRILSQIKTKKDEKKKRTREKSPQNKHESKDHSWGRPNSHSDSPGTLQRQRKRFHADRRDYEKIQDRENGNHKHNVVRGRRSYKDADERHVTRKTPLQEKPDFSGARRYDRYDSSRTNSDGHKSYRRLSRARNLSEEQPRVEGSQHIAGRIRQASPRRYENEDRTRRGASEAFSLKKASSSLSQTRIRRSPPRISESPARRSLERRRYSPVRSMKPQTPNSVANSLSSEREHDKISKGMPRGPVLSREWKEKLQDAEIRKKMIIEAVDGSDSDANCLATSSDSDVGPPQQMAELIEMRRKEKDAVPLLKNKAENTSSITESILSLRDEKLERQVIKEDNQEEEDVFASCRRVLEEDIEKHKKLEEMMEEGRRHEEEKSEKLDHLERMEILKEKLEAKKRVATAETGTAFVKSLKKDAYMSDKQTLEKRIKRYAARRRKDVIEDNLLDDES